MTQMLRCDAEGQDASACSQLWQGTPQLPPPLLSHLSSQLSNIFQQNYIGQSSSFQLI